MSDPLPRSETESSKSEPPKLRHEFVGMMFAVAIGEVGLRTATLVQAHHWVHFLPAYIHLFLATLVIATSWVGWTLSPSPGARTDVKSVLQWEFLVLLLDVFLVVMYFILAHSVDFTGDLVIKLNPSAAPESFWILVIFSTYFVWDLLTKGVMYFKEKRKEPWFRHYGVRIIPTFSCLILAYVIKRFVEGADPSHVLTADIALICLVLLFRALKDLTSALLPKPGVIPSALRSRRRWAVGWSVLFLVGIVLSVMWTARVWHIPKYIVDQIEGPSSTGVTKQKIETSTQ